MTEKNADYGTVLPEGSTALVVDREGQLSFLMPKGAADEEIPEMAQLLAAVILRSRDPEWVEETIAILGEFKMN